MKTICRHIAHFTEKMFSRVRHPPRPPPPPPPGDGFSVNNKNCTNESTIVENIDILFFNLLLPQNRYQSSIYSVLLRGQ